MYLFLTSAGGRKVEQQIGKLVRSVDNSAVQILFRHAKKPISSNTWPSGTQLEIFAS